MKRIVLAAIAAAFAVPAQRAARCTEPQFNDDHAFTKAMVKFEELVKKYSGGKNRELRVAQEQ